MEGGGWGGGTPQMPPTYGDVGGKMAQCGDSVGRGWHGGGGSQRRGQQSAPAARCHGDGGGPDGGGGGHRDSSPPRTGDSDAATNSSATAPPTALLKLCAPPPNPPPPDKCPHLVAPCSAWGSQPPGGGGGCSKGSQSPLLCPHCAPPAHGGVPKGLPPLGAPQGLNPPHTHEEHRR